MIQRQAAPTGTAVPSPLWLQMPGLLEKMNVDFSNTLSDFSGALRRLSEQQNLASYWKDMYDRLHNDYKKLEETVRQMNFAVAQRDKMSQEKDEAIARLQSEVNVLQMEMAGQSLSALARNTEFVGLQEADLRDWITSPSMSGCEEEG